MNISIIGTGIYSVALALNITKNNHKVTMWSENKKLVTSLTKNKTFKPITNAPIPKNIKFTNDLKLLFANPDLIIIASSAKYFREICLNIKGYYNTKIPICIASKGIENHTCKFLSDITKEILKAKHLGVISGPTFAQDLIHNEPCALSLATTTKKATRIIAEVLSNDFLKFRSNTDLYGTELCGSIKNVIAIASGILDGLGYTESTRAFLITEALHDIKELLYKLECNPKTILSFAGIGDLILTCSSPKSRNYSYGVLLGQKKSPEIISKYLNNNTVEGYYTLLSIKELTKNRKIKMPIINIIYDIAINNKEPKILVDFLINKD